MKLIVYGYVVNLTKTEERTVDFLILDRLEAGEHYCELDSEGNHSKDCICPDIIAGKVLQSIPKIQTAMKKGKDKFKKRTCTCETTKFEYCPSCQQYLDYRQELAVTIIVYSEIFHPAPAVTKVV